MPFVLGTALGKKNPYAPPGSFAQQLRRLPDGTFRIVVPKGDLFLRVGPCYSTAPGSWSRNQGMGFLGECFFVDSRFPINLTRLEACNWW